MTTATTAITTAGPVNAARQPYALASAPANHTATKPPTW
jgi:hypothetical protein